MNQEAEAFREVPAFGLNGQAPPQRVTAAPSTPMAVARDVIGDCFRDGSSVLLRHHRGDFYQYDGTCWPQAEDNGIKSQTYKWLEWALFEKETRTGTVLVPWSPTSGKVSNVIDACRALTHLPATVEAPAWIDLGIDGQGGQGGQGNSTLFSARDLIALKNGLLHLPSRKLLSHTPAFFSQNCLPYAYDAAAECPRWLEFLGQLWPEDKQSIATLQEMLGYIVSGDTTQQKIFLILGPRRAGKGTISRVVSGMLGKHNVAAPTLAGLASNFGLQEIITRPLAIITDARLSSKTDSALVVERLLSISGEDPQQIDRKYRDPWNGRLPTRLLVLTNELPRLIDSSGALAGRFVLLVLTESFFGRENPALTDELLKEAPGILNWALLGLDRLSKRGHFVTPEASREVAQQMEDLASPMGAFVRSCCQVGPYEVETDQLWRAWLAWCANQNRLPGNKSLFGRDLKAVLPGIGHARPRAAGDTRAQVYTGIGLQEKTVPNCPDRPDHPDQADTTAEPPVSTGPSLASAARPLVEETF